MRIKKFNEGIITKKDSPFINWEMMEELIAPIFKYDWTIYYKLYMIYDEGNSNSHWPMPIGPKHTKNFTDQFWVKTADTLGLNIEENGYSLGSTNKPVVYGSIIDINDKIFNALSSDEQRSGRNFSTYDSEKLIQILEDIERIKDDCITEGYTLSMFMKNDGFNSTTNFNRDAQISLLILDGVFK
jgi:hypothetical protein